MPLDQLPPPPHNTRGGATGGQPFRWAVIHNENAFWEAEFFQNGILLGWNGWDQTFNQGPFWRYWDGSLFGRRIWIEQRQELLQPYTWMAAWYEPGEGDAMMLAKKQQPTHNRPPWDDVPFNYPWLPIVPGSDYLILPGDTWVYWYRTAQDALAEFPDALRQDDYWETFGRSIGELPDIEAIVAALLEF